MMAQMRPVPTAIAAFLVLLLSLPLFAQDPSVGNARPGTAEERAGATSALEALGNGDRDKLGVLLGLAVAEKDLEVWRAALQERIDTIDLLEAVRGSMARLEADQSDPEAEIAAAKAAVEKIASLDPLPLPEPPWDEPVARGQADREKERATLAAAESNRDRRRKALAKLEANLSRFPAEKSDLLREIKAAEAESLQGIGAYLQATRRVRLAYVTEWLALALTAHPHAVAERNLGQAEYDVARARYGRLRDYLTRLGEEVRKDHSFQAKLFRKEAEKSEAAGRKRQAELAVTRAGFHEDLGFLEAVKVRSEIEEDANAILRDDLAWIKERFQDGSEVSSRTAVVLGKLLRRARGVEAKMVEEEHPWLTDRLGEYGEVRADITDRLRELGRNHGQPELVTALGDRKGTANRVVASLRTLDSLFRERGQILSEMRPLIVRRIYRARVEKPLGIGTLTGAASEAMRLARLYTGKRNAEGIASAYHLSAGKFLTIIFATCGLLFLGIWLIRRAGHRLPTPEGDGGPAPGTLRRLLAIVALSSAGPLCLVLAAVLPRLLSIPAESYRPYRQLLFTLALALFLWRFLWMLFREDGFAVAVIGTPPEVASQLLATTRWMLLGIYVVALPWWVLDHLDLVPAVVHLPRLFFTLTLAWFGFLLLRLLRRDGPFANRVTGGAGFRHLVWHPLWVLFAIGLLMILVLDVLGYRYGTRILAVAVAQVLIGLFLVIGFFSLFRRIVEDASKDVRRRMLEEMDRAEARAEAEKAMARVLRFVSVLAALVTVVLLARYWGVTSATAGLLSTVRLGVVDAEAGLYVTLWDALKALFWIVGAHVLVFHLPAIYQFSIFPRLPKLDAGTRFVVVAVSRYAITIIGYCAAVLTLHLSFTSLGWIFAALSVGIGFGLQEVISNFISGLLLFIERPVRVGDTIDVGGVTGTVQKISIRATEVVNFDRQVIIIPNRDFITSQVTNWNHNDQVMRTVITIGVAYTEDVDRVSKILTEIVESTPNVLTHPPFRVVLHEFGASSLDFQIRAFSQIADRVELMNTMKFEILRRFRKAGIEIPFPQQDLHLRSVDEGVCLPSQPVPDPE